MDSFPELRAGQIAGIFVVENCDFFTTVKNRFFFFKERNRRNPRQVLRPV